MKIVSFKLAESRPLTPNISLIRLSGDTSGIRLPGEFVDVAVPGHFLRRPFSVMNWDPGTLELLIARVGSGTTLLQNLPIGTEMEIITGLGHGFIKKAGAPLQSSVFVPEKMSAVSNAFKLSAERLLFSRKTVPKV